MLCPKCASPTERVEHAGVIVDRCSRCRGLWFDRGERERLLESVGAEQLDDGTDALGRRWNPITNVQCPRCRVRTVSLVDPRHPEVGFEQCPDCGGSFLDAGEFRKLRRRRWTHALSALFGFG